ncbi:ubiquitin carboxyl-terminal hydrolase 25-like [Saccoglossus kowalevskii]|uniref:Ubiquitin carboxyl-terminal hydrolase 25-like n=1 Tax=Saccoglossus kowalevskii TaxID=10224 RepID=A0ABM0H0K7_SACKO|nr:PREDICTED: ubiquitin carboxyl-terminal hydrolase 25-like [Saccoglossus kowalevskii]
MFGASGDGLVWEQQSFSMSAMTVESNVLQQHALQNQDQIINQLKEITGIHDVQTLQKAYSVSHGDVSQAVQLLTSETTTDAAPTQVVPVGEVSDPTPAIPDVQYGPKTKSQAAGVIDLTNEGDDKADLRRAIALSLQETQTPSANIGVSAEEQDISRALEESLAETKHGAKRKRGEGWFVDPLNPHERQRENGWPVGLKNVGNTCWFSAVIQSLFHLPLFRHLVLEFKPIHPKLENATTPEDIVVSSNGVDLSFPFILIVQGTTLSETCIVIHVPAFLNIILIWCNCGGRCQILPTVKECVCCREITVVDAKCLEAVFEFGLKKDCNASRNIQASNVLV